MKLEKNESITRSEKRVLNTGKWVLINIVSVLVIFYFYNFYNTTMLTQESSAQFGDYFGGVLNPVLSFATICLLVWSIQIQLRELKLTRDELKLNTKSLQEQALELKRQNNFLIQKENDNSLHSEFEMYQRLFLEQQSVLNELLNKPLGFVVGNEDITASDLIYKKNTTYQSVFNEHSSDNVTKLNFAKYQIAHTLNQSEWILEKMLARCYLPGFVNAIKTNIDWLLPFISVLCEKQLISVERAREMYDLIKQNIRNSDFKDFEQNILKERLHIHASSSIM